MRAVRRRAPAAMCGAFGLSRGISAPPRCCCFCIFLARQLQPSPSAAMVAPEIRERRAEPAGGLAPSVERAATVTNCIPNGCFAEFALNDDMLKKLRAASGVGKLSFADAGAHPLSVPIAFNGFGQAFDALSKK
jgi:hypothetical protein